MKYSKSSLHFVVAVLVLVFLPSDSIRADDAPSSGIGWGAQTMTNGLRIFTCGNSFHWYVPPILQDMAQKAGIPGTQIIGISKLGGSMAIQHWNIPDQKNQAKAALSAGKVDVLTLACMLHPDDGIEKLTRLGLQYNPNIRVTIQEFWIPSDKFEWPYHGDIQQVDFDATSIADLRKMHAPYFKEMDAYVRDLNSQLGREVLFAVPAGQAILNLREKIVAGLVPSIQKQSELFADKIGHPRPPLQALVAYCNFAVIYRRNPVGLPMPAVLTKANNPRWDDHLNRVLQEIAWDAVTQDPQSGLPQKSTP